MGKYTAYKSMVCILIIAGLSSCSFFQIRKPIIEQGNIIEEKAVAELRPGMSKAQVVAVMGTPVLVSILTPDRVEYIYTYQRSARVHTERRVVLIFSQGRLQSIQRSDG
jgi:outer membrane protein assembly factor BamE